MEHYAELKNRHQYSLQTKSNMNELRSLLYADMGTQNIYAKINTASMSQLGTIRVLPCHLPSLLEN
jgi:hypothetical protein